MFHQTKREAAFHQAKRGQRTCSSMSASGKAALGPALMYRSMISLISTTAATSPVVPPAVPPPAAAALLLSHRDAAWPCGVRERVCN